MTIDAGFSERLGNVMAVSNALVNAGQDSGEAQEQARGLENEIFQGAGSNDDYQDRMDKLLLHLQFGSIQADDTTLDVDAEEILNLEGPTFGEYEFATFHQDGQMSTVFKAKAKDKHAIEPIVALKVTHPAMMAPPHNSEREARILAEARHDHVVPLLKSFSEPGGRLVLVFPFLRQDLENLLRSGSLTRKQSGLVFIGLFSALAHIHSLGIIHRDVKPSNILMRSMDGPVYLADFGIAWSPHDRDSEPASQKITDVGTTSYRPPELLFGYRSYDASLDMWAAGCVVAEMIRQGHHPVFDAGPLGSELGLIKSMFTTLGTPDGVSWPSAQQYPDWGKMRFQVFPPQNWRDILPGAPSSAVDFISNTVCYESTRRLASAEALKHPLGSEIGQGLKS